MGSASRAGGAAATAPVHNQMAVLPRWADLLQEGIKALKGLFGR
jgi:hypothetical protein